MLDAEYARAFVKPAWFEERDGLKVLSGVILQEGRAATGGRAELFAPGACIWQEQGVELRNRHSSRMGSRILARVKPVREDDGTIRFSVPISDAIRRVCNATGGGLSAEFVPLMEHRTAAGVREIEHALLLGCAFVRAPEYAQAKAEIRQRAERRW